MDLSLANWDGTIRPDGILHVVGEPALAGLYGPFETPEAAERYRLLVEENGTRLVLTEATDPATYPRSEVPSH